MPIPAGADDVVHQHGQGAVSNVVVLVQVSGLGTNRASFVAGQQVAARMVFGNRRNRLGFAAS